MIDIREWSIWGGGWIERFYCIYIYTLYIYVFIYTHICICVYVHYMYSIYIHIYIYTHIYIYIYGWMVEENRLWISITPWPPNKAKLKCGWPGQSSGRKQTTQLFALWNFWVLSSFGKYFIQLNTVLFPSAKAPTSLSCRNLFPEINILNFLS